MQRIPWTQNFIRIFHKYQNIQEQRNSKQFLKHFLKKRTKFFKRCIENLTFNWVAAIENEGDCILINYI